MATSKRDIGLYSKNHWPECIDVWHGPGDPSLFSWSPWGHKWL